jgi:hypothetical protein
MVALAAITEARGVGQNLTQRSSETDLLVSGFRTSVDVDSRSMWSWLVGVGMLWVGKDPNPVPDVRRTNGGSWYAMPFSVKPDLGQVSENLAKPPASLFRRATKQC